MTEITNQTEYPTNRDVIARAEIWRDLAGQGNSQKYKSNMARQYAQCAQNLAVKIEEQERAEGFLHYRLRNLKRMAEKHAGRAEDLENEADSENRIRIFHHYEDLHTRVPDPACAQDPVYRTLDKMWSRSQENFTNLLKRKRLSYAINSRKNPSVKRHRQLFNQTLFEALKRIEDRSMKEEEYTMIQDDLEGYLMKTYVETRDALNEHMVRVEDLRQKYASGNPMTDQEKLALALSVIQI